MAMQGPDFRAHFIDPAPASTADVGRTIAHLLRLELKDKGKLIGRVLSEAMPDGVIPEISVRVARSEPSTEGLVTVLNMQVVGSTRYFDAAGFPGRTVGLSNTPISTVTPSGKGH
jgi:hypothetical protein